MIRPKIQSSKAILATIIFVGLLSLVGWILYFTSKSSNAQIINEQKAEVAEYKNTVLELQKNQEIQQLLTKKKQKSLSQLAEETEKNTTELGNTIQQIKKENLEQKKIIQEQIRSIDNEQKKLKDVNEKYNKLLEQAHHKLSSQPPTEKSLEQWYDLIKQFPSDPIEDRKRHSILASSYYSIGHFEKVKQHLELAQSIDPVLEKQLLKNLNIEQAISMIHLAIKEGVEQDKILTKLKHAHTLVNNLAKDKTSEKYTKLLLELETKVALTGPPKLALGAMLKLTKANKVVASSPDTNLLYKLNYLNTLTKAYSLSVALSETKQSAQIKKEIYQASEYIIAIKKDHPDVAFAKASVALSELDNLFLEGNSSQIFSKVKTIESLCKTATPEDRIYFRSSITGHRAAIYVERGQITNGRNIIAEGIKSLTKLDKNGIHGNLIQFRLATLYWLQAQFTTNRSSSILSLNKSINVLSETLKKVEVTEARRMVHFSATVEGELAELSERIGKKKQAKEHYIRSLKYWQNIVTNWGKNDELQAAISYCQWRIDQL